jgi:hypothetical protein
VDPSCITLSIANENYLPTREETNECMFIENQKTTYCFEHTNIPEKSGNYIATIILSEIREFAGILVNPVTFNVVVTPGKIFKNIFKNY